MLDAFLDIQSWVKGVVMSDWDVMRDEVMEFAREVLWHVFADDFEDDYEIEASVKASLSPSPFSSN